MQGFYQSPRVFYSSAPIISHRTASLEILVAPVHYQSSKPMHEQKEVQPYAESVAPKIRENFCVYAPSARASSFRYNNVQNYFASPSKKEYHAVDGFLKLYRPKTQFIAAAEEIEILVRETFEKTTGEQFPDNIVVRVLEQEDMKAVHAATAGNWSNAIQGFSLNTSPVKQIFVKAGDLDKVIIVVGHEIGHVLTPLVENIHDEEAKAFAFECAWVETIIKYNIGNMKDNFTLDLNPAQNGLHDVASAFVKTLVRKGKDALEMYKELAKRMLSVSFGYK